jgi:hypothetical protein
VRGGGGRFDLEFAVDLVDLSFQLERDGAPAGGKPTAHFERVVLRIDRVGYEPDPPMVLSVKEVCRP